MELIIKFEYAACKWMTMNQPQNYADYGSFLYIPFLIPLLSPLLDIYLEGL